MMGWTLSGAAILFMMWVIIACKSLISLRDNVRNAWEQIDAQLKRRHDLIFNFVSAVKGALEFEEDALEEVINARAKAVSSVGTQEKAGAENMLTRAMGKLFAVMENYPDLKSNANITQLQEELASTENKIIFSRQLYKDLVHNYRSKQEVFPGTIITSVLKGFQKEEYPEASAADWIVPGAAIGARKSRTC
jgi:LemA protein